ncbi:hypothetical protein SAMN04487887_11711 [Enterococcus casseliflavus]|uniref:DUF7006 family protein n=1 Tax=Enterococcus casseliflavus TaxID=37734 RepID=UPI0008F0705A|nr:hypothetical protein [Enterococcus casseliflavus]SFE56917.1 hypothetical protein SAMN04487887_11711 [Enterococcus casseliflavus]
MLAETIHSPEEYLAYSKKVLMDSGFLEKHQKIAAYYEELCLEFKAIYGNQEPLFKKFGNLLAVDAQLQILLELVNVFKGDFPRDFELKEEHLIDMIRQDKDSYYRELTGFTMREVPKWGLIYLSEK